MVVRHSHSRRAWRREFLRQSGWRDVGDLETSPCIALTASGLGAPHASLNYLRKRLWDDFGIASRMGAVFIPPFFKHFPYQKFAASLCGQIIVMEAQFPGKPIILIGQSLGARACAAAYKVMQDDTARITQISKIFLLCVPMFGPESVFIPGSARMAREGKEILDVVDRSKIVAIHAKGDEIVSPEHSFIPDATNVFVDTGYDTAPPHFFANLIPLYSKMPWRHCALAWHEEVPQIIARHALAGT